MKFNYSPRGTPSSAFSPIRSPWCILVRLSAGGKPPRGRGGLPGRVWLGPRLRRVTALYRLESPAAEQEDSRGINWCSDAGLYPSLFPGGGQAGSGCWLSLAQTGCPSVRWGTAWGGDRRVDIAVWLVWAQCKGVLYFAPHSFIPLGHHSPGALPRWVGH